MDWSNFDKFSEVIDRFMQPHGEGDTMASQIVTAINKIVYKWFNDGDVFDNTNGYMLGFANDLSSYANWLFKYVPRSRPVLEGIYQCYEHEDYENLLFDLCEECLDSNYIEKFVNEEKEGTIYDCTGPFVWTDIDDYEEYEEWEEEYEDDYEEE